MKYDPTYIKDLVPSTNWRKIMLLKLYVALIGQLCTTNVSRYLASLLEVKCDEQNLETMAHAFTRGYFPQEMDMSAINMFHAQWMGLESLRKSFWQRNIILRLLKLVDGNIKHPRALNIYPQSQAPSTCSHIKAWQH